MDGSYGHKWLTQIKQVVSTKSLYLIFWYSWGIPNSNLQQNLKKMIVLALNMFIIGSCGQGLDDLNQILIFFDFWFWIQHMNLPKKIIVIWFFSLELIATNNEEKKNFSPQRNQGSDDLNQIVIFFDFSFWIQHMILPNKIIVIWFFSLELVVTNCEEEKNKFSYKAGNCNWVFLSWKWISVLLSRNGLVSCSAFGSLAFRVSSKSDKNCGS